MHILNMDIPATNNHLASLRADADSLEHITLPPLPAVGPIAPLVDALTRAVHTANGQSDLLEREAHRIADNMTVFREKAQLIDAASAHRFEAIQS